MFVLPDLPYAQNALEPVMSARTLGIHHGKHHASYVATLNKLLEASPSRLRTLEQVILDAAASDDAKLFNNAAQAWNHSFFWVSMTERPDQPAGQLASAISDQFKDIDGLKQAFVEAGVNQFGSGWVWLAADGAARLVVRATHDADDTLTQPELTPLLVCDLWEHAYYLDHQNNREAFLEAWFDSLANWRFAGLQYAAAKGRGERWRHPASTTKSPARGATSPVAA